MANYGTTNQAIHNDGTSHGNSEEDALLPRKEQQISAPRRFVRHMKADIDKKYSDLILLYCYVITGLLDSCATSTWGSFVSMQTGNTVYLGTGLADPSASNRWIKSLTSIVSFCFGSFFFSRLHRHLGGRKRWVLTMSFVMQLVMILIAATLTTLSKPVKEELSWRVLVPLAIIAFQSSGQAVTSRVLQHGSLTSVVLTSIYCDLFSDIKIFVWPTENTERNRRAAAPLLLLVGALLGGFWARTDLGLSGAVWTAAGLKMFIVFAWLFWKSDPESLHP